MLHEDSSENVINSKEFFFQDASDVVPLSLNDVSTPHSDNLPLSEVTEEVLRTNLAVVLTIVVPVLQRNELNRLIVHICREAFL